MSQHELPGITVVLPFFNQAAVLESILNSWSHTLQKLGRSYEILLIDDGSTDGGVSLLEGTEGKAGLFKRIAHLYLERHEARRGYGACIRTALEKARYPLFFYTGFDHPYQPADLKTMLHNIEETDPDSGEKVDLVNGFRAMTPLPNWRRILGKWYRVFLRVALGANSDPLPGWLARKHTAWPGKCAYYSGFGSTTSTADSNFFAGRSSIDSQFSPTAISFMARSWPRRIF